MTDPSRSDQGEPTNPLDRLANKLQDVNTADAELDEVELLPFVGDDFGVPIGLKRLGDFELLERIGAGGMGAVYRARQRSLDKLVAVKVIRPDFTYDAGRIARFRGEALAASKVQHPGIVSVHFVGEQDGVHYIAQELIEGGRTLADLIQERRDAPPRDHHRSMAELFAKIADALETVHQAKVIHRDIKPGNILITPQGEPKVADFGLAKDLDGVNLLTSGETPGTLAYKSPEHLDKRIGSVDARSDLFSLGVSLYEALTFTRPFVGNEVEVAARILHREVEDLRATYSGVPAELSVICRKAMEKEPHRRYQSMAELAADLRRYLNNEPILAQPSSVVRRAQLWVRRRPVMSATLALGGVALTVISVLLAQQIAIANELVNSNIAWAAEARRAEEQAAAARTAKEEAESSALSMRNVATFQSRLTARIDTAALGYDLVERVRRRARSTLASAGRSVQDVEELLAEFDTVVFAANPVDVAREIVEHHFISAADAALVGRFPEDPRAEVALRLSLSEVERTLRFHDAAEAQLDRALNLAVSRNGWIHSDVALALNQRSVLFADMGRLEEAEAGLREAIELRQLTTKPDPAELISSCASLVAVLHARGRCSEAEDLASRTLNDAQVTLGASHPTTLAIHNNLAALLLDMGRSAEARSHFSIVAEVSPCAHGVDSLEAIRASNNWAHFLEQTGRVAESIEVTKSALQSARRQLGDDHPFVLSLRSNLASARCRLGNTAEWQRDMQDVLADKERLLGPCHADTLLELNNLAAQLREAGAFTDSERKYRTALARASTLPTELSTTLMSLRRGLGRTLFLTGQHSDSATFLEIARQDCLRLYGRESLETVRVTIELANALDAGGEQTELAAAMYGDALSTARTVRGMDDSELASLLNNYGMALRKIDRAEDAERYLRESLVLLLSVEGGFGSHALRTTNNLGALLIRAGRYNEALNILKPAVENADLHSADDGQVARIICRRIGQAMTATGRLQEAAKVLLATHDALQGLRVDTKEHEYLLDAIVDLYVALEAVEPSNSYGIELERWRGRRAALEQTTESGSSLHDSRAKR
ncbi:MAG: serine/threonine protein kinase [Planctomycetes bacterium]|nr:serine/threonine protein kinase [Planctomycetota bacterium]